MPVSRSSSSSVPAPGTQCSLSRDVQELAKAVQGWQEEQGERRAAVSCDTRAVTAHWKASSRILGCSWGPL